MFVAEKLPHLPGRFKRTREYGFDWEVKQEALRRTDGRCFLTGEKGTSWDAIEIHHGLAVSVWYHYFRDTVPHALLVSVHNAIPLKHSVHKELHEQADMVHWQQMATQLLIMARDDQEEQQRNRLAG